MFKEAFEIRPGDPGWDPGWIEYPHQDDPVARAKWLYALYANPGRLRIYKAHQEYLRKKYGGAIPWTEEYVLAMYRLYRLGYRYEGRSLRRARKERKRKGY